MEIDDVFPEIKKGLEEKLEAMVRRELYTKYKTAPIEEEREKARQLISFLLVAIYYKNNERVSEDVYESE